jgi:S-adenosylmethionine decarboxylase
VNDNSAVNAMDFLGKQIIAELYCCNRQRLDDVDFIRQAMINAARAAGTQIVTETFHRFSPQGVSGAVIIADSHLAIHTWPEHGYAAVDLFTCSETLYSEKAVDYLRDALESQQSSVEELRRGNGLE